MKRVQDDISEAVRQRYEKAFNFFQSKSINLIISHHKNDHVINFRDMEFMDDDVQYLKRYYQTSESLIRVHKLINYYENNMTPPSPNLIPIENYAIMDARHRKLLKLDIMREKSFARRRQQNECPENNPDPSSKEYILPQLEDSKFSEIQSAQDDSYDQSYDSENHDIYEAKNEVDYIKKDGFYDSREMIIEDKQSDNKSDAIFSLKDIKQSNLIINFRTIIGLKKSKDFREQKVFQQSQSEKNQNHKLIKQPPIMTALGRTNFASSDHLIAKKSPEPILIELTESHDPNDGHQKIKKGSFMEYYNSISKKNSNKLLQKYIKSKR